jgi:hypothetical protein
MNIPDKINWRGSTYIMESVDESMVYWYNPISRHRESCTIENWKAGIPYDRDLGGSQG